MTQAEILLVDDDRELSDLLTEYLSAADYVVSVAYDAEAAQQLITQGKHFDIAIFDIMMPGTSGLELLQQLRPSWPTPVIMLTGRGDDIDRILGLEMGADDYLAKPCNPRELQARINAILRRATVYGRGDNRQEQPIHQGTIALHPANRELRVAGRETCLTSAEFNALKCLMQHSGQVVSKARLTEQVLHRRITAYDRAIDVHISRIRQKLGEQLGDQDVIKTIRGEGYLFVPQ